MRLVIERENTTAAGSIPGRLYVDGVPFAYTLENAAAAIPAGEFPIYTRFSPKFAAYKVAIDVPGRKYIMFHGGNQKDQSAGCVLTAKNRVNLDYINGDSSAQLYAIVADAMAAGDAVKVRVRNRINWLLGAAIVAAGIYLITR